MPGTWGLLFSKNQLISTALICSVLFSSRERLFWHKKTIVVTTPNYTPLQCGARALKTWKDSALCTNLESVTDLKRIQTPHSLCCDFRGDKTFTTRWSGDRVQVWIQVWAPWPACHLAISPKAVPEGNWRFGGQNQRPSSWGSSYAQLALPSRLQSLLAATCSLEETR